MIVAAEINEPEKWVVIRNGQRHGGLYESKEKADQTANALRQLLESQGQKEIIVEVKQHLLG